MTEKKVIEDLINVILEDAITSRASDIHIEPMSNNIRVRFRVDGNLQEKLSWPLGKYEETINKIKVLSGLDITTHNIPQDGHFEVSTGEKSTGHKFQLKKIKPKERIIDIRVSIFPTTYGEVVVLRLLNREEMLIPLKNLDMDTQTLSKVKELIMRAYGMLLVTGPAGSGKTTLLYSILNELENKEKNIVTLEDPVELYLEGVRQTQIKTGHKLTFARAMRSILRQDPDVIMIGEIRDPETAEYATRASLTGRSVLSTVHANNTIGTVARLLDMGIEKSLIAYALNGVISKRLIRKTCPHCKAPYQPNPEYLKFLELKETDHQFVKGKGCDKCLGTGYYDRIGIFEVLEFDDNLRSLIVESSPMETLQNYAIKTGLKTLKQDAKEKVLADSTTPEEAMKVI